MKALEWMADRGHIPDFCVVGEATNPTRLGETVKIGRRGSLTARIETKGSEGHVAYPKSLVNPVHSLVAALHKLTSEMLDDGTEWFEPSSLQVTTVDVGNPTANLTPAAARVQLNIRFNDAHSAESLKAWVRAAVSQYDQDAVIEFALSGEPFLTTPDVATDTLVSAIQAVTGLQPSYDTGAERQTRDLSPGTAESLSLA